eukprot:CFRG3016T1
MKTDEDNTQTTRQHLLLLIDGSGSMSGYYKEFRTNYVAPLLHHFKSMDKVETSCAVVVYREHNTDLPVEMLPFTTSHQKVLSWYDRLKFYGGFSSVALSEGLALALQLLDDNATDVVTAQYCVVVGNSAPHVNPVVFSARYKGKTCFDMAQDCSRLGIQLSVIAPRDIRLLRLLYKKAHCDTSAIKEQEIIAIDGQIVLLRLPNTISERFAVRVDQNALTTKSFNDGTSIKHTVQTPVNLIPATVKTPMPGLSPATRGPYITTPTPGNSASETTTWRGVLRWSQIESSHCYITAQFYTGGNRTHGISLDKLPQTLEVSAVHGKDNIKVNPSSEFQDSGGLVFTTSAFHFQNENEKAANESKVEMLKARLSQKELYGYVQLPPNPEGKDILLFATNASANVRLFGIFVPNLNSVHNVLRHQQVTTPQAIGTPQNSMGTVLSMSPTANPQMAHSLGINTPPSNMNANMYSQQQQLQLMQNQKQRPAQSLAQQQQSQQQAMLQQQHILNYSQQQQPR